MLDAYAAGFFDGEGSIMIRYDRRCRSYILKVSVSNCVREVLEEFKKKFGGSIVNYAPRKAHHLGWSEWLLQGRSAKPFLDAIYPWTKIKTEQIELAYKLLATYQTKTQRGRPLDDATVAIRRELKEAMHALKTKGRGLRGAQFVGEKNAEAPRI